MFHIAVIILSTFLFSFKADKSSDCNPDEKIVKENSVQESTIPEHLKGHLELIWNDEFDGHHVDTTKWNYRGEGTTRHHAIVSRNTIALDGKGHVSIKVTKENDGKYYVGQLGTDGILNTKYGYFECRAKMNKTIGPHVAFWLQSPDIHKIGDPASTGTEIDIFEYHKKEPEIIHHNLHWNGYGVDHKQTGKKINYPDIQSGYHTFGLEWNENEYIFFVNGKETWRTTTAVSQRNEYIILSTELTGFGGNPELGSYPDEVLFDYVRIYSFKN